MARELRFPADRRRGLLVISWLMITLIEALDFRCFRYISQRLDAFHVLVGPNASGKTTFLDVVAFLGDLVSHGIEKAVGDRTANFQDLTWRREGEGFELAIEARIPEELRAELHDHRFDTIRYEVALKLDASSQETLLAGETASLRTGPTRRPFYLPRFRACRTYRTAF